MSLFEISLPYIFLFQLFRHPPTYTLGLLKLKRSVCCLPFSWFSLCMYILGRLWFGHILVYTLSVFYNCDTIGHLFVCVHFGVFCGIYTFPTLSVGYNCYTSGLYMYILCILRLNKYTFITLLYNALCMEYG